MYELCIDLYDVCFDLFCDVMVVCKLCCLDVCGKIISIVVDVFYDFCFVVEWCDVVYWFENFFLYVLGGIW